MDSNHYDSTNLLGCPGQQFTTAPSFALWTYMPCCHTFLIYCVRLILIILAIPVGLPLLCLAIGVLLPLGIICLPCLCCIDDLEDSSIGQIAVKLLLAAAAVLAFLLWLPFCILLSPIAFTLYATSAVEFEPWLYVIGPAIYPIFILAWSGEDD